MRQSATNPVYRICRPDRGFAALVCAVRTRIGAASNRRCIARDRRLFPLSVANRSANFRRCAAAYSSGQRPKLPHPVYAKRNYRMRNSVEIIPDQRNFPDGTRNPPASILPARRCARPSSSRRCPTRHQAAGGRTRRALRYEPYAGSRGVGSSAIRRPGRCASPPHRDHGEADAG